MYDIAASVVERAAENTMLTENAKAEYWKRIDKVDTWVLIEIYKNAHLIINCGKEFHNNGKIYMRSQQQFFHFYLSEYFLVLSFGQFWSVPCKFLQKYFKMH